MSGAIISAGDITTVASFDNVFWPEIVISNILFYIIQANTLKDPA